MFDDEPTEPARPSLLCYVPREEAEHGFEVASEEPVHRPPHRGHVVHRETPSSAAIMGSG